MGLEMKDKKKVREEIARRYHKADKTGRGKLLDEYTVPPAITGTSPPISCQTGLKAVCQGGG
jgi:hypothetical protein